MIIRKNILDAKHKQSYAIENMFKSLKIGKNS